MNKKRLQKKQNKTCFSLYPIGVVILVKMFEVSIDYALLVEPLFT